jgi:hypothetical protein
MEAVLQLTSCLFPGHRIVHEEDEWFGILLFVEPIPAQMSPERDRRRSALPTLPFIVAEVIDLAYAVWQDAIRSDEIVWID